MSKFSKPVHVDTGHQGLVLNVDDVDHNGYDVKIVSIGGTVVTVPQQILSEMIKVNSKYAADQLNEQERKLVTDFLYEGNDKFDLIAQLLERMTIGEQRDILDEAARMVDELGEL